MVPTMSDLWRKAKAKNGVKFDHVVKLTKFPKDDSNFQGNIETLLSHCKIRVEFNEGVNRTLILDFIDDTEEIIRNKLIS